MDSVAKLLAKMPSTSPCPLGPSCGSPKKKGRALLLHTAVPKVLQEFLPEFRSSLDACKRNIPGSNPNSLFYESITDPQGIHYESISNSLWIHYGSM